MDSGNRAISYWLPVTQAHKIVEDKEDEDEDAGSRNGKPSNPHSLVP